VELRERSGFPETTDNGGACFLFQGAIIKLAQTSEVSKTSEVFRAQHFSENLLAQTSEVSKTSEVFRAQHFSENLY
jgi:hypothetical protein